MEQAMTLIPDVEQGLLSGYKAVVLYTEKCGYLKFDLR